MNIYIKDKMRVLNVKKKKKKGIVNSSVLWMRWTKRKNYALELGQLVTETSKFEAN